MRLCDDSADRAQHNNNKGLFPKQRVISQTKRIFLKPAREGTDTKEKKVNKFTKQCVAAFASLAMAGTLCVAGAVVANSSAWAADTCNNGAPWSDACNTQTGSIKITKYEDKGANVKTTPLPGAKFKVTKINGYNLTQYSDWENLAKKVADLNKNPNDASITGTAVSDQLNEGTDKTLFKTNAQGIANVKNLAIGLYKVEEAEAAPGYSKDVTPFFMTIPEITHEAGQPVKYNYNVTVDPKNQSLANRITKTLVRTDGAGTEFVGKGDTMTYKISADVLSTSATDRAKWTKSDL